MVRPLSGIGTQQRRVEKNGNMLFFFVLNCAESLRENRACDTFSHAYNRRRLHFFWLAALMSTTALVDRMAWILTPGCAGNKDKMSQTK